jgi:hypothetical protein
MEVLATLAVTPPCLGLALILQFGTPEDYSLGTALEDGQQRGAHSNMSSRPEIDRALWTGVWTHSG